MIPEEDDTPSLKDLRDQAVRDALLGKSRPPARPLPLVPSLARMVVAFNAYDRTPEAITGSRKDRQLYEQMRQRMALMQANGTMAPFLAKVADQLRDRIASTMPPMTMEVDELGRPVAFNYTMPVPP